jgi:cytoskeletal protein CcmA (bactofilin family)
MAYASVIGSSSIIRGNVRGDSSLEILGRIEGDVGVTGDLTLGREAVVVGTVSGARVIIGGSVQGDVRGTEAVLIAETGRVIGDLSAPRIGMSEGAHVQGSVRTDGVSGAPPRASVQRAESRAAAVPAERAPARSANVSSAAISSAAMSSAAMPSAPSHAKPAPLPPRKQPPPPVIQAPRPGARARKKLARR